LTVLNSPIFPKERWTLLRSLFEKIFIYYTEFNSLIKMSQVYVFMYGNSCLIKSIFFEVEKIKVCLILLNDCRFERNGFNIIMTLGKSFINETLKSLFTFGIELNIISEIIFNLWRLNLNKILFIIFDLLLNLLVLLVVLNLNCFLLLISHISLLLFSTVNLSYFFHFPLIFFTYFRYLIILNLFLFLFDNLFIFF